MNLKIGSLALLLVGNIPLSLAQGKQAMPVTSSALKRLICSEIATTYELGSSWSRNVCAKSTQFVATGGTTDVWVGKTVTTRLMGFVNSNIGSCGFSVVRMFPTPQVDRLGKIIMAKMKWSVDKVLCQNAKKLTPLKDVFVGDPSVVKAPSDKVWAMLTRSGKNDPSPDFVLGDGYYSCDQGDWYFVMGLDGKPRGALWEGPCSYTEDGSPDKEIYTVIYDTTGAAL